MIAEIVSVGTEILLGQIADTNAQFLGKVLPEYGVSHLLRQTVGDNLGRVTEALRLALSRSDIVFTIGGLGPTEDDLTREGVAAALGQELVLDEELAGRLKASFLARNIPWSEVQLKQAHRPTGSTILENPNGSACGLHVEKGGKHIILLPGPKNEFGPMVQHQVRPILARLAGTGAIVSRTLKVIGLGESMVERRLKSLLDSSNPTIATYAKTGEVHVRLTAMGSNRADALSKLEPFEADATLMLGDHMFGVDQATIEDSVIRLLHDKKMTVGVAESITGGGIGRRLTNVSGSSAAFLGGFITYNVAVKEALLGVDDEAAADPVSSYCAQQMAIGARRRLGADFGVSATGNAGPDADLGGKPVGLVYISIASRKAVVVEEFKFRGIREDIRNRTEQAALALLRKQLLGQKPM